MGFSGISSDPGKYAVVMRKEGNFEKNDIEKKGGYLPEVTMDGVHGIMICINKNYGVHGERINAGRGSGYDDNIHIFVPYDYNTKYETMVFVENKDGDFIPVMVPNCTSDPDRGEPYAYRHKLNLSNALQKLVFEYLKQNWYHIRKYSMQKTHIDDLYDTSNGFTIDSAVISKREKEESRATNELDRKRHWDEKVKRSQKFGEPLFD